MHHIISSTQATTCALHHNTNADPGGYPDDSWGMLGVVR